MLGGGECTSNEHGLSNLSSAALITAFFNLSRWVKFLATLQFLGVLEVSNVVAAEKGGV